MQGLTINIPPKSDAATEHAQRHSTKGKIKIVVDEFVFDDSQLVIGTDKPNKDPKIFDLKHIVLHDLGSHISVTL